MSDTKANARLNQKKSSVKFKDDDYETHSKILETILPHITEYKKIYDPFYCNGTIIKEWEKIDKICYNTKEDAFNREHPEDYEIVISNIPFSMKEKCVKLCLGLNKPFMLLMPIDAMGSKWIKKYWDELQFLIPNGRYNFLKNGEMGKGAWFDSMWVCKGLDLPCKIVKL